MYISEMLQVVYGGLIIIGRTLLTCHCSLPLKACMCNVIMNETGYECATDYVACSGKSLDSFTVYKAATARKKENVVCYTDC